MTTVFANIDRSSLHKIHRHSDTVYCRTTNNNYHKLRPILHCAEGNRWDNNTSLLLLCRPKVSVAMAGPSCRATNRKRVSTYRSICSLRCETNNTAPVHCCTLNVYFASHTKHTLPYKMAACTW